MATTALDKKAALQKQIEDLQKKVQDLDQEAIHELKLKLSDARKVVRDFEDQLSSLTGQPAEKKTRVRRERRASITDEHLQPQVLKVMADHGKLGLNAKQLAEKLNQDALRVRKFINANPKVLKRTGKGVGTKFFLP
jgi:flagellar biosynthesis chaperone FliJ